MAAYMICAYYDREADSRSLFETRKLASGATSVNGTQELGWDAYLGKFDVISLVMTDCLERNETVQDVIACLMEEV